MVVLWVKLIRIRWGGSFNYKKEVIIMHQAWQYEFYNSSAWKKCRAAYRKKAGGLCEECLSKGIISAGVEVHHIKHLTEQNVNDPKIALNFDNLKLLCKECHENEHRRKKRFKVDEHGRVTAVG